MNSVAFIAFYALTITSLCDCKVWEDVGKTLRYLRSSPEPGLGKETFVVDSKEELSNWPKQEPSDFNPARGAFEDAAHRVRRATGKDSKPEHKFYHFNDSHYVAEVHWAGSNSSIILMLMRDPKPTATRPNYFYVSTDYGKTFTNITDKFMINGSHVVINDYYPSPINNNHYIITAKFHKYIFISTDACKTFRSHRVQFTPTKIKFHPTYWRYILAYDEDHPRNQLYVSTNFGISWRYKASYVRSFYWGVKNYDSASAFYVEKRLPGQRSTITKQYAYWYAYTLLTNVEDFDLVDKYMFASQKNASAGGIVVQISYRRGRFKMAEFPSEPTPADSYVFGDASEDQLFVAVDRNKQATLYISDETGLVYSESLQRILYHNKDYNPTLPVSSSLNKSFIDLYRVKGIYGIYVATQLSNADPGKRKLKTFISYDKGGEWNAITPPTYNADGALTTCHVSRGCSLHLSQTFGTYGLYTRFQPMLSKKSAPGLIIAQGSLGQSLKTIPNVYLTADGGVTWREILKGNWFYRFADHGGIIVAIKRYGLVDTLSYSWDDAESWHNYKFTNTKIRVYGLLTEPGEKTTIFTIFGSYSTKHSWLIVQVDMKTVLGSPCMSNQYKNWTVVDQSNSTFNCLLGKRQTFEKRAPKEICYNGKDYDRPVFSYNCPCTREDFECDEGFIDEFDWFKTVCADDKTDRFDPFAQPAVCPPGSFYNKTKGYRKISGDSCIGGREKQFAPIPTACPTPEASRFLWYAQRNSIHRISLDSPHTDIRFRINGLRLVLSVDFDLKTNTLFWGDVSKDRIYRLHLNGSGYIEEIKGFEQWRSHVESIAFDWTSQNIYWTDTGLKQIGVVRAYPVVGMPAMKVARVLLTENLDKPRAIALHPTAGYMFWTDWGTNARIERAYMDGTHRTAIVTRNIIWPNGITVDVKNNKIYWTEGKLDKIEVADLNGNNRQTVFSYNVRHPYSISSLDGNLYWGDWSQATIEKGTTSGSSRSVVKSSVYSIMEIKAFSQTSQQGTAACSSNPCQYICLNRPGGYNCTCPENLITQIRNGRVHCTCPAGTKMESNGECRSTSRTCSSTEFRCDNNNCIPTSYKCDFDNDCKDNSDERDCVYDSCSPTKFKCPNGRCIPATYKCDGDNDCGDSSDEVGCSKNCSRGMFKCSSLRCIPQRWVCDGENDCHDNSDERNCQNGTTVKPITTPLNCQGKVLCTDGSKCIPKSYFCNGIPDCPDRSDEPLGCHVICRTGQFRCWHVNKCVDNSKVCDGKNDCGDRSDETGCTTTTKPYSTPCAFRCPNGHCLKASQICDGKKDCYPSNADEMNCKITTAGPKPVECPREFKCFTEPKCVPLSARCNRKYDCTDGSDELNCPTSSGKVDCSYPFGFNCSENEPCVNSLKRCDGQQDCLNMKDENKTVCESARRVNGFQAKVENSDVRLSWKPLVNALNALGYHLIFRSKTHQGEIDPVVGAFHYDYLLKGLHGCSNYKIALGVNTNGLSKPDWLYAFTSIVTPVDEDLAKPTDLKFVQEVNQHAGILSWTESKYCLLESRKVLCVYQKNNTSINQWFDAKGSLAELQIDELTHYNCTVEIFLKNEETGQAKTLRSSWYHFKTSKFGGKVQPQKGGKKSTKSTLVWVIPVVLVVLILVVALVIMVTKYRSLQRSFMAFANRGYSRAEEEDEDVAVTFHQGEDAPMINRFSDDEPLVV